MGADDGAAAGEELVEHQAPMGEHAMSPWPWPLRGKVECCDMKCDHAIVVRLNTTTTIASGNTWAWGSMSCLGGLWPRVGMGGMPCHSMTSTRKFGAYLGQGMALSSSWARMGAVKRALVGCWHVHSRVNGHVLGKAWHLAPVGHAWGQSTAHWWGAGMCTHPLMGRCKGLCLLLSD
ncbi:hypothetical protein F0562_036229 [Nyssa sinensis]|uniref:Uncharacterized protein n=1 Tax=Nyssa sinensis TaxID=561372 RepID=A0A5J5AF40_9ASTE|nr:hypothetical protein F0562_036229 [Nyssa sinensis]